MPGGPGREPEIQPACPKATVRDPSRPRPRRQTNGRAHIPGCSRRRRATHPPIFTLARRPRRDTRTNGPLRHSPACWAAGGWQAVWWKTIRPRLAALSIDDHPHLPRGERNAMAGQTRLAVSVSSGSRKSRSSRTRPSSLKRSNHTPARFSVPPSASLVSPSSGLIAVGRAACQTGTGLTPPLRTRGPGVRAPDRGTDAAARTHPRHKEP